MRAMASSKVSSTDVLLREFTHRVKNEFASAIQVVSFAAEKSADRNVKAALEGVMEKLHDYASVHRALEHRFVQMVTAMLTGCAVHVKTRGWEDPLPRPVTPGIRYLRARAPGGSRSPYKSVRPFFALSSASVSGGAAPSMRM